MEMNSFSRAKEWEHGKEIRRKRSKKNWILFFMNNTSFYPMPKIILIFTLPRKGKVENCDKPAEKITSYLSIILAILCKIWYNKFDTH